ncbi:unnamed protein product [Symbiodinium sp. CCMP2456]|nr:unnamed protein product [Symbiodinium sp. CCMP2456]
MLLDVGCCTQGSLESRSQQKGQELAAGVKLRVQRSQPARTSGCSVAVQSQSQHFFFCHARQGPHQESMEATAVQAAGLLPESRQERRRECAISGCREPYLCFFALGLLSFIERCLNGWHRNSLFLPELLACQARITYAVASRL